MANSNAFIEALSDSTLLTSSMLNQAMKQAEETPDAEELANTLVKQHLVTKWQAKQLLAGKRHFHLGKYKLVDILGRGGMGTVYQAEHTGLGRMVALKVMSRRLLKNRNAVSRFLSEIRTAAELDHPNIVKAFDADCVKDRYFLVMEYVPGQSLAEWQKQDGRFFLGWTCECIRQAALGLQHAAEHNVVHRDIKPSNMIVPSHNKKTPALVKLLDFGLAFCLDAMENRHHTQAGRTVGTVDYMAPEQAISSHDINPQSDIYSLGCVFFQLLTGRLMFEGHSAVERLSMRLSQPAPLLSEFRPDAPVQLDRILAKMLERDRSQRFQWPIEVAESLLPFAYLVGTQQPLGLPPARKSRG